MDIAHAYTDEELKKLERKFRKIYQQAADEMYEKLEIYLNSLAAKDAAMLTKLSNGKITSKQYQAWRAQQILVGEQMETIAADLAKSCTDANIMALKALNADLSDVFAENANYIMYAAEMVTGENYAFTLYNQNAVNRLIKDNPQLLPKPRVKIAKDRKWNQRVITSAVTQGILQGESMQNIAKRMHGEVSKGITVESIKNANRMTAEQVAKAVERRIMVAAMRTARTAVTGAENAGRLQGYKELQSNGVDIKQQWVATLDNRTRHEHRMLDGQIREIGEPFEVDGYKLDFPADPKGEAHLVYNCRCTTISVINGHEIDIDVRDKSVIGDYEEWKNGKKMDAAEPPKENGGAFKKLSSADVKNPEYQRLLSAAETNKVEYREVKPLGKPRDKDDIIKVIAGGDMTSGSCASLGLCYIAQRNGLDVTDFRGGSSQKMFSWTFNLNALSRAKGVKSLRADGKSDITVGNNLLKKCEEGKEYYLCVGRHASIVRLLNGQLQYLELQSSSRSGWNDFNGNPRYTLKTRFGCRSSSSRMASEYSFLIDIEESDFSGDEFRTLMGYINTEKSKQKKGAAGYAK